MKPILAALILLFATTTYAQKNEVWINANSGLFHFVGESAVSTTSMVYALDGSMAYAQAYGRKNGVGYGLSLSAQRVTKYKLIYGLEGGYEHFSSKATIDRGMYTPSFATSSLMPTTASGKSTAEYSFINFHPYIGYRIKCSNINIDVTGGIDMAITTKANAEVKATATQDVKVTNDLHKPEPDIRPRVQVNASYKSVGIYAGYSWGERNYMEGYVGGNPEAYPRIFRFGISYRLL